MKASLNSRYYQNPCINDDGRSIEKGALIAQIRTTLSSMYTSLYQTISRFSRHRRTKGDTDFSIYTGLVGILMTFRRLHRCLYPNESLPEIDSEYIKSARVNPNELNRSIGLCSSSIALLCYQHWISNTILDVSILKQALDVVEANELLYGKAGLAIIVNFFEFHGLQLSENNFISHILNKIPIEQYPWQWHGSVYLGCAHGTIGILQTMLNFPFTNNNETNETTKNTNNSNDINASNSMNTRRIIKEKAYEIIQSSQITKSGNFKSNIDSTNDKLVQWCHGAPGFISTLTSLIRDVDIDVDHSNDLSQRLRQSLHCIWIRGIVCKSCGLCHGIAGNAYAQLRGYQGTRDILYLYRTMAFAKIIVDQHGLHDLFGCAQTDNPFSLFEGFSGTSQFLMDLLAILEANEEGGIDPDYVFVDHLRIF